MKTFKNLLILCGVLSNSLFGQIKPTDVTKTIGQSKSAENLKPGNESDSKLPPEVKSVLDEYINILSTSKDLDECAQRFTSIAGGELINEDPINVTLRQTVKPFSLKKDFNNIKFYEIPVKITKVSTSQIRDVGVGDAKMNGTMYKIWIAKKNSEQGMPAPIAIMVPDNHPHIKTPKVVQIGSL